MGKKIKREKIETFADCVVKSTMLYINDMLVKKYKRGLTLKGWGVIEEEKGNDNC